MNNHSNRAVGSAATVRRTDATVDQPSAEQKLIHWFWHNQHEALQLVALDQVKAYAKSTIRADEERLRRHIENHKLEVD